MSTAVRVLVLPLFKRYWLWHAWKEAPASSGPPKPWREGGSVHEKLQLLAGSIQRWGSKQGEQQWHKLATAPEGTLNHRLFRLAQEVLSRVDPNESFLKVLPQQADVLEFRYPSSLPERLVRRRLRLLAAKAQPFHASRLRLWSLALIPQIPLIPLPLPNVTIYFTIWRIISNRSAGNGAAALSDALDRLSDLQRLKCAQQFVALQQQGVQLRPHSWAAELAADADRLQQELQCNFPAQDSTSSSSTDSAQPSHEQQPQQPRHTVGSAEQSQQDQLKVPPHQHNKQQQQEQHAKQQRQQHKGLPLPVFIPDRELEQLVEPHTRLSEFLPELNVEKVAQLYCQPHLLDHYRAARKTCAKSSSAPY